MEQSAQAEGIVIFIILLSIALLSIFDTQILSIFRRQKEIGTYVALGMTPRKVMGLFTLEGTMYSMLATFVSIVWGTPFLLWFAQVGYPMPVEDDFGIALGDALMPVFKITSILTIIVVVVVFSSLISYLPARKIARQNMVLALRGKIN
jgi:ABC-type lipoprotein release transport system permease subunit